ncbi:MAG: hypothetical protein V1678_03130 [Candidatus Aenigmatarchaeota archaeon]
MKGMNYEMLLYLIIILIAAIIIFLFISNSVLQDLWKFSPF